MGLYERYEMKDLVVQDTNLVPLERKLQLIYEVPDFVQIISVASDDQGEKKIRKQVKKELKKLNSAGAPLDGSNFGKKGRQGGMAASCHRGGDRCRMCF